MSAVVASSVHIRGWTVVPAGLRSAVCGLGPGAVGLVRLQEKESKGGLAVAGSSNRVNSSVAKALTWSRVVVRRAAMQGTGLLPMSTKFGNRGRLSDARAQTEAKAEIRSSRTRSVGWPVGCWQVGWLAQ